MTPRTCGLFCQCKRETKTRGAHTVRFLAFSAQNGENTDIALFMHCPPILLSWRWVLLNRVSEQTNILAVGKLGGAYIISSFSGVFRPLSGGNKHPFRFL